MGSASSRRNKLRRRFYKPYNKIVHGKRYFLCRYFGADFLVSSANVGGLEISAKIGEYAEIRNFIVTCAVLKPDVFIDIGANLGLYTCILMRNRLVPRTISFEPDRRNRVHLHANLLINEQDKERLRQLLVTLEEKRRIVDLLSAYLDARQEAVRVVVGLEDTAPHLNNFVLIGAPARVGNEVVGSLAVIGPTRIDYEHTITAVSYIARLFDQFWNEST